MAFVDNIVEKESDEPTVLVRTPLPLDNKAMAEIVAFKNLCDDKEHIALIFPTANASKTPLVRLHSECLTGDVFGSARCDCGHQLQEAKNLLGREGGILLYLRQEGRGIGLYPKLDAYRLQSEQGLDTFSANRHLGFEEDERSFEVAAEMLKALGIKNIRLLTNNPDKAASLKMSGIIIEEIVPTGLFVNPHNEHYLQSKRKKGHTV